MKKNFDLEFVGGLLCCACVLFMMYDVICIFH